MVSIHRITNSGLGSCVPLARGPWRYPLIHPEHSTRTDCGYEPINTLQDGSTVFGCYRMGDLNSFSRWQDNPISNQCPDIAFGIVAAGAEPPLPARAFHGLMGRLVALERNLNVLLPILDQSSPFGFRIKELWTAPSLAGVECFALVHAYEPLLVYEGTRLGYTFPLELGWEPREPSACLGEDITIFSGIGGQSGDSRIEPIAGPLLPRNPHKITYHPLPAGYINPNLFAGAWDVANAA